MKIYVLIAALCIALLAACSSSVEQPSSYSELPPGDASSGAQLFVAGANGAPACSTCHTLDGTTLVGPSLQNYAATAPVAEAGAASLADYTFTSITQPSAYVVSGFSNSMYTQYGRQLSPQQIADLIAYLHTL